ncbi:hypothetical protein P20652_0086 [Pseudoalteromonas sp. BSi20652]|nr:hypothetical protein P20652_0086 [Pseudoalteromonas sp. BSi20652]
MRFNSVPNDDMFPYSNCLLTRALSLKMSFLNSLLSYIHGDE